MAKKNQLALFDLTPTKRRSLKLPPHNGTSTSVGASQSVSTISSTLREQVFTFIKANGGKTCYEVETAMELRHQTASARIWELRHLGLVRDSGERRKTSSNRNAIVWVAA